MLIKTISNCAEVVNHFLLFCANICNDKVIVYIRRRLVGPLIDSPGLIACNYDFWRILWVCFVAYTYFMLVYSFWPNSTTIEHIFSKFITINVYLWWCVHHLRYSAFLLRHFGWFPRIAFTRSTGFKFLSQQPVILQCYSTIVLHKN